MSLTGAAAASAQAGRPAATVRLTVKVTDRNGQSAAPLDLQLMNLRSGTNVDLGSATSRSVRPGRYNVAAWIPTGTAPHQSYTLADQVIDLTRSQTVSLDARQGKLVRFSLDVPDAAQEALEIAPSFGGGVRWAFNPTTIVSTPVHDTYVVPAAIRGLTFNAYAVWEKSGNTAADPSPFRYDVVQIFRDGIPAHPVYRIRRASLALVRVTVRATNADQQAFLELAPIASQPLPFNAATTLGPTPARLDSYRTPGYRWQPIVSMNSPSGDIRDNNLNAPTYNQGHFSEQYGDAVLAPNLNDIFADVEGRRLQAGESQFPLQDPLSPTDEGTGLTQQLQLYAGGKLLVSSRGGTLNTDIPRSARWYNLRLTASRRSGATLSTQITGVWHFAAHAIPRSRGDLGPPIYETRLLPAGLDLHNSAAPGAITKVALGVTGIISAQPLRMAAVRAWSSAGDGARWTPVRVSRIGDRYTLDVHDPGSPGFVSLRVYVRAAGGASEQLTVIHAYVVR